MDGHTHPRTDKDLALRFLEVLNRGEFDRLGEVLADDVIIEWPQSRERIRGLRNAREVFKRYPGGLQASDRIVFAQGDDDRYVVTPMFTVVKTGGAGDLYTAVVRSTYPDGSEWYVVLMMQTADGRITKVVNYFGPLYDPPEWRAEWVERMGDDEL